MSNNPLYHAAGLRGVRLTRIDFKEGHVIFNVQLTKAKLACVECDPKAVILRGKTERVLHSTPMGS